MKVSLFTSALADFNKADLLSQNNDPNLATVRGQCKSALNDFKGAIADFTKALVKSPGKAQALTGRGYAYYRIRNNKSALADFNQSISLFAGDAETYYKEGLLKCG